MEPAIIIAIIWLACGVAAYGGIFAQLLYEFPNERPSSLRWVGVFMFIFGPFGLFAAIITTGIMSGRPFKHGWKL